MNIYKPAGSNSRRFVDWRSMSDENLAFALRLLSSHYSPYEVDCANEIQRREVERQQAVFVDNTPPPLVIVPQKGYKVRSCSTLWVLGVGGGGGLFRKKSA